MELETWVEGKGRDTLQVCSVANPGGKKFLHMQSVYRNLWVYYVLQNQTSDQVRFRKFSNLSTKLEKELVIGNFRATTFG